ncbi:phosphatase PAP2 family protein [Thermosipho ferrireducens]|uniref:Phosphatase PAP2 family protein n=1 Tax=Thermosipho ferrireducens TaxID=2571116 RepID=A0ABX7S8J7_9BACT|nr:phosphatase PAP2 family protein [Thermosipho ferrireducens]QTA38110.1 phosphatase PAP2 family protein [Thermosipho ferrireducens]
MKQILIVFFIFFIFSILFSFSIEEIKNDISSITITEDYALFIPFTLVDEPIRNNLPSETNFFIVNFINNMDTKDFLMLSGITALITYLDDPYLSFTIIESTLFTGGVTQLLKFLTGRARPYENKGSFHFRPFNFENSYHSFPSGHSSLAWAIFTPIAEKYGNIWLVIPAIFSISRVLGDYHWTSDVIAGAILGYNIGKTFFKTKSAP